MTRRTGSKWRRLRIWIPPVLILILFLLSLPEINHRNQGESESTGSVRKGKLINGWLLPYRGPNFRYFSLTSYYLLNNAYVHHRVHRTILDAYKACETTCPDTRFVLMECTRKRGGRMWFHWTHQNGLSVDFMVPKKRADGKRPLSDRAGLIHYLLDFDPPGHLRYNARTRIDNEAMARHLLAVEEAARANGLRIRKVLFNTGLQAALYNTPAGRTLADSGIRIVPRVNKLVDRFHDDHYHIDFEIAED